MNVAGGGISQPTLMSRALESLYDVTAGKSSRDTSKVRSARMRFSSVTLYASEGAAPCATHFSYSDSPRRAERPGTLEMGRTVIEVIARTACARDCASAARTSPCLPTMSAMATMGSRGPGPTPPRAAEPAPFAERDDAGDARDARDRGENARGGGRGPALGADAGAAP